MKKYLFKTRMLLFFAMCGIALVSASCANEDVAQNGTNTEQNSDKNLTTFVAGGEAKTRTSLNYDSGNFYWEAGDYIYVKDDDGVMQKSSNAPTSKVASFKYKVPGKFNASTSYKVYYLGKNSSGNQVAILANQSQTAPNNTEHFGVSGDYGTATATKITGAQRFSFELDHQPAYLVFQPYVSNTVLKSTYLTKIEVSSDNDIVETYTFNSSTDSFTGSAGSKQIILNTKGSGTYANGFPLTNSSASVTTNGAYVIIKPGSHTLKVRFWVKDVVTNVEGSITKLYPSASYASNTYYDMTANLRVRNFDGDNYYMWDAQQQYWKDYEWNSANPLQPVLIGTSNSNYAQSNTDSRYYHEGGGSGRFDATQTCAALPNVNEMTWYAAKGDPRWDGDRLWATMGHLYKGGIWFKKKTSIVGYNADTAVDGTDWRTNGNGKGWTVSNTLPSATEIGNYFYLPALGYYESGRLYGLGRSGYYWSSSASPWYNNNSYGLHFSSGSVGVYNTDRHCGFRIGGFK